MSDASCAWSGAIQPSNITSRSAMDRRANTKALGEFQVCGSDTRSTHQRAEELDSSHRWRKEISTSRALHAAAGRMGLQEPQNTCGVRRGTAKAAAEWHGTTARSYTEALCHPETLCHPERSEGSGPLGTGDRLARGSFNAQWPRSIAPLGMTKRFCAIKERQSRSQFPHTHRPPEAVRGPEATFRRRRARRNGGRPARGASSASSGRRRRARTSRVANA